MKIRIFFKYLLMFIIPYLCSAFVFAGIFLSIIIHTHSLWRILLCAFLFAIFMYFVRIAVEYPRENLRVLWSTNDKSKSEQPIIYKILNFIIDVFVGFLIIILVRETVPHNVVVNYFVGVSFAALFISLLIGNLIKPSLAVVEDTGSNE